MDHWLGDYDLSEFYTDERPPRWRLDTSLFALLTDEWAGWYVWRN